MWVLSGLSRMLSTSIARSSCLVNRFNRVCLVNASERRVSASGCLLVIENPSKTRKHARTQPPNGWLDCDLQLQVSNFRIARRFACNFISTYSHSNLVLRIILRVSPRNLTRESKRIFTSFDSFPAAAGLSQTSAILFARCKVR